MEKISFVLFFLSVVSCGGLDKYPSDKINPDSYFKTAAGLKLYTNSFYDYLPDGADIYKTDGELSDYFATASHPPDFLSGTYSAEDSDGWDWDELRNINYFLEHFNNDAIPLSDRNHYEGMARLFRALFYYKMVKKFGDVPWYEGTLSSSDPNLYKKQDPRDTVMKHVLEDLDFACSNMRETKDGTASTVNKWVALAYKARICLFEGTFRKYNTQFGLGGSADGWLEEAASAAKELMDKGGYSLNTSGETPYRDLFIKEAVNTDEVILADNYSSSKARYNDANWVWTSSTAWVCPSLTKRFINTFLNIDGSRFTDSPGYDSSVFADETSGRDARLAQMIRTPGYELLGKEVPPDPGAARTCYQFIKYVQDDNPQFAAARNTNSIPIIRYAEVLLDYAESMAELGKFSEDIWDVTIRPLRERAGITDASMPPTIDKYLQSRFFPDISDVAILEIRRERGIELAGEGRRFDDLRRWKEGWLLTRTWDGMYVDSLGKEYDLNGDGSPDVCFVTKMPDHPAEGVYYYVLSDSFALSHGTYGNIEIYPNVTKVFDERQYLYPVPASAILLNKNLVQNEGWKD